MVSVNQEQSEQKVGARLKGLRESKGLTLRELGELTGVSAGNLSQAEAGKLVLGLRRLKRIADALGVSLGWLATGGEDGGAVATHGTSTTAMSEIAERTTGTGVPVRGIVQAGQGFVIATDRIGETGRLGRESFSAKAWALRVEGAGYAPLIPEGSLVVIEPLPDRKSIPATGVIVARHGTELALRQVFVTPDTIYLAPLHAAGGAPVPLGDGWEVNGVVAAIEYPPATPSAFARLTPVQAAQLLRRRRRRH